MGPHPQAIPNLKEIVDLTAPIINEKLREYENSESQQAQQIQALGSELRAFLAQHKLSYQERIHHDYVGTHPCNRSYQMLTPVDVHQLLHTITCKGWSQEETALACAVEVPHGEAGEEMRQRNAELVSKAGGLLAPIRAETIRVATVCCSHTTAALRVAFHARGSAVLACPGHEDLATDGFLSRARIEEKCPSIVEALQKGITYTIVRWQIAEACPKLMEALSEADNAKHDSFRKETAMQAMFNIHSRAVACVAETDADYNRIARIAARGHSAEFATAVRHYCDYVRQYSGGKDGHLLKELDDFGKTLTISRDVPSEFFSQLAKVNLPQAPLYVAALVKATQSCPDKYVGAGGARLFGQGDLASLQGKNKEHALRAHAVQKQARVLVADMGVASEPATKRIIGNLDVRLTMHIHGKTAPNRRAFTSLAEIGVECYQELVAQFGDKARATPSPWTTVKLASASTARAASASGLQGGLRELSASGNIPESTISAAGYEVGTRVGASAGAPTGVIQSLDAGEALIAYEDREERVPYSALVDYAIEKPAEEELTCMASYRWRGRGSGRGKTWCQFVSRACSRERGAIYICRHALCIRACKHACIQRACSLIRVASKLA